MIKLVTDFWTKEKVTFDKLLFISTLKGKEEIVFQTDLNNKMATLNFFKNIINLFKTKEFYKSFVKSQTVDNAKNYQFGVLNRKNEIVPIKWFDLKIGKDIISHDIAFSTTLIKKNGNAIMLGKFPSWSKPQKLPLFREFKIKIKAYKFLINQIKNQ